MSNDQQPTPVALPFGAEFQQSLLRLILDDDQFATRVLEHLHPTYFENEPLGWVCSTIERYRQHYGGIPSSAVLRNEALRVDPRLRQLYLAVIDQIAVASLKDEEWLRDQVLDFVKRNIFVRTYQETRSLYNTGKVDKAYDLMMERMDQITRTTWAPVDRVWFYDDFPVRQMRRIREHPGSDAVTTGIGWLNNILGGGLHPGELGIWVGPAKGGKSTVLTHHGVAATRLGMVPTLHIFLEGMRKQLEGRYDANLMDEVYQKVKYGEITGDQYTKTMAEYAYLRRLLVLRGFSDDWNYSVTDINEELRALKRQHNWVPKLIIIDYGDLLTGRDKNYDNEREKQKAAYRDMKLLANAGYAVWTASQGQRPVKGSEDDPEPLRARQIADCYEKVRVADFIGSINGTRAERKEKLARLYAELYRDNEAESQLLVRADFSKMQIREEAGLVSPSKPDAKSTNKLGYGQMLSPA